MTNHRKRWKIFVVDLIKRHWKHKTYKQFNNLQGSQIFRFPFDCYRILSILFKLVDDSLKCFTIDATEDTQHNLTGFQEEEVGKGDSTKDIKWFPIHLITMFKIFAYLTNVTWIIYPLFIKQQFLFINHIIRLRIWLLSQLEKITYYGRFLQQ